MKLMKEETKNYAFKAFFQQSAKLISGILWAHKIDIDFGPHTKSYRIHPKNTTEKKQNRNNKCKNMFYFC